jgi:hypothetical protein
MGSRTPRTIGDELKKSSVKSVLFHLALLVCKGDDESHCRLKITREYD